MRFLQNSNNLMQISTGQTAITYTYCGSNILTDITHPPSTKIITSLIRPIEQHQAFCDELKSALEDGRDYFEVILSGYLFLMDKEENEKFINWFNLLGGSGQRSATEDVDRSLNKQRDDNLRSLFY